MHGGDNSPRGPMVDTLLDEFLVAVIAESKGRKLRRAVVRSQLSCNILVLLSKHELHVAAEMVRSTPTTLVIEQPEREFTAAQMLEAARWDFGYDDPFVISFPISVLTLSPDARRGIVAAVASAHVQAEEQRAIKAVAMVNIHPVFGPAAFALDSRLVFVLMPFAEDLTTIYKAVVKPTVEGPDFGLVCRRADDYATNTAIMHDIWKAICEARIVIADLTNLNANVMYELGIAHTVGKDTILIYQRQANAAPKFPFDLAHIRRIEYENSAPGGKHLESQLKATIRNILQPSAVS
jgi:hypothetical protein